MCALLFWCSFKFSMYFSCVTWNASVLNHCGETREEKINDQLWDYSVINCIPFVSELSTVRYWKWNYWLICPDLFTHAFSLSVNWISARSELTLSVWKFGQDRFQNKITEAFLSRPSLITDISRINPELFSKLCSMYMSKKQRHHSNLYPTLNTHDTHSCEKQGKMLSTALHVDTSTRYHGQPLPLYRPKATHKTIIIIIIIKKYIQIKKSQFNNSLHTKTPKHKRTQPLRREIEWPRRARLQKLSLPANSRTDQRNPVPVLQTQIKKNKNNRMEPGEFQTKL